MSPDERESKGILSILVVSGLVAILIALTFYVSQQTKPAETIVKTVKEPGYETIWCSPVTNSCHEVKVVRYVGPYLATKQLINKNEPSKWTEGQMFEAPVRLVKGEDGHFYSDDTPIASE